MASGWLCHILVTTAVMMNVFTIVMVATDSHHLTGVKRTQLLQKLKFSGQSVLIVYSVRFCGKELSFCNSF